MWSAVAGLCIPVVVATCVSTFGIRAGWIVIFNLTAAMCTVALVMWNAYQSSDVIHELNTPRSVKSTSGSVRSMCGWYIGGNGVLMPSVLCGGQGGAVKVA